MEAGVQSQTLSNLYIAWMCAFVRLMHISLTQKEDYTEEVTFEIL
jgi:hypothetical protein